MSAGMACNVGRHLYVDLQLYVFNNLLDSTNETLIEPYAMYNDKYCMKHVHV